MTIDLPILIMQMSPGIRSISSFFKLLLCSHFAEIQWGGLIFTVYMSHCQNSSKFLSIAYFMKTADVIMFFFSSYDRTNHTC